jgi:uncharacterized protein YgiM (DUF1202 family)
MKLVFLFIPVTLLFLISLSVFSADKKMSVDANGGLRMRDSANLDGNIISTIPNGTTVSVLTETGETVTISNRTGRWTQVSWNGKSGWVFGGFLADPELCNYSDLCGNWKEKKEYPFSINFDCEAEMVSTVNVLGEHASDSKNNTIVSCDWTSRNGKRARKFHLKSVYEDDYEFDLFVIKNKDSIILEWIDQPAANMTLYRDDSQ